MAKTRCESVGAKVLSAKNQIDRHTYERRILNFLSYTTFLSISVTLQAMSGRGLSHYLLQVHSRPDRQIGNPMAFCRFVVSEAVADSFSIAASFSPFLVIAFLVVLR